MAFAKTAMGIITLFFGFLGILARLYGIQTMIAILILLSIAGAIVSPFLPKTSGEQLA